jgi:hypothetical protein
VRRYFLFARIGGSGYHEDNSWSVFRVMAWRLGEYGLVCITKTDDHCLRFESSDVHLFGSSPQSGCSVGTVLSSMAELADGSVSLVSLFSLFLQTRLSSRPEHRVEVRKIVDDLAYQDVMDGSALVIAIGICFLSERLRGM